MNGKEGETNGERGYFAIQVGEILEDLIIRSKLMHHYGQQHKTDS